MNKNKPDTTQAKNALNHLLIGQSLEENLFKLQYLIALAQQSVTPNSSIPIKANALVGLELILEYAQLLVDLEINRLPKK